MVFAEGRFAPEPWRLIARSIRWLLFVIGALYLVWAARAAAYSHSMDYAVVVDMARNMASGTDFPVFFYGQAYMGSLEPAISALICLLFGPSPFCVCLGTTILGIATLFAIMETGRRLAGEWGGILSLLLAITGSFHWIHFMVSPRGGYALASLLTLSSLAFASIGSFCDDRDGRIRIPPAALFGLMAGLAFWNFWIALPAFAAAGLVLLCRLRLRVFSLRFILPCLTTFFVGSSPWWIWTIKNGLGALDMEGSGPRPLGWGAIRKLFAIVIPRFYGTTPTFPEFWRSMLPWALATVLLVSVASILAGRDKARKSFLGATALYTALFAVAYAKSSFGSMGNARYLVPFVPVFSVLCGAALGSLLETGREPSEERIRAKAFRLAAAVVALGFYALGAATPSVRTCIANFKTFKAKGIKWRTNVETVACDPVLTKTAAFADFSLFGYNWASDRRICLVSPIRWRYAPYLEQLEDAANPAVINNFFSFRTFCKASEGVWRDRRVGKTIITEIVEPPVETEEVPSAAAPLVKTEEGTDVSRELFDDNCATGVQLLQTSDDDPFLDVFLNPTSVVNGVSIMMDPYQTAIGWQVDFIDKDGGVIPGISEKPHRGWFWSGPRPYQFGPETRWTIRWAHHEQAGTANRIRISFTSNRQRGPIFISDMRFISDKPLSPTDIGALRDAIATARQRNADLRLHAGRWLGRQIGAPPDPAMRFGQSADFLGNPEVCKYVTVDPARPHLLIFRDPGVAHAAADTLKSLDLDFEQTTAGGYGLISVPRHEAGGTNSVPLRFIGGRLMRDAPPAMDTNRYEPMDIDFGGFLSLSGLSPLPKTIHPGDTVCVDMVWQFSQTHRFKKPVNVFVHGIQNGEIIFQAAATVDPANARRPADRPHPAPQILQMGVPKDVKAGEVTIAICVKRDAPLSRRIKPTGKDLAVTSRRAVLGHATVVKE